MYIYIYVQIFHQHGTYLIWSEQRVEYVARDICRIGVKLDARRRIDIHN